MTMGAKSALAVAATIRSGERSATSVIEQTLARIADRGARLNCFTRVLADRALARAADLDRRMAAGEALGPLAGVPFGVKNLYDIAGEITTAGSLINRDDPPATADAILIQRLEQAGAILVGALHMGEYAYDFTGENAHDGPCRNPRDSERMTGGSSSGSGAAVGAGLVPIALGSDTSGSVRVPAALCGVFGLKPTYGRLPRTGTFPFVDSLDHVGPLAASVVDLAMVYDVSQGWDGGDHTCVQRPTAMTLDTLEQPLEDIRIARAGGFFATDAYPDAQAAVDRVCAALNVTGEESMPGAAAGRAAAVLISSGEGAALHRQRLLARAEDYDPDTRDRFLAGALLPAEWYLQAQNARRRWQLEMRAVFDRVDLLVTATTPYPAPLLGTRHIDIAGRTELLRPNLGLFTQPFSCVGLPAISVPVWLEGSELPMGVQLIAPPWREDLCLRAARFLERAGVADARVV